AAEAGHRRRTRASGRNLGRRYREISIRLDHPRAAPLRTAAPDDSCRRSSYRSRRGDRGVAPLHERNRAPTVAGAAVAYRARQAWALVHGNDPAPQGEKHRRRQPGGVGVSADRKGGPRTVARSPLDPYGAVRSTTVPATCAPALARYLRCHRATCVLAPVWPADSLAVLPGFVVQQYPERPQRSDKPLDDEAHESDEWRPLR